MPISKSAKKALRVSLKKTSLNRYRKALIKEALKNVDQKSVNAAVSMLDKGVKWGIFHQNKAARLKSQLSKKFSTKPVTDKVATKAKIAKPVAKKPVTKPKTSKKVSSKK